VSERAPVCGEQLNESDECSQFDILIMVGPDDREMVKRAVLAARANIIGHRRMIIISHENYLTKSSVGVSGGEEVAAVEWISDEFIESALQSRYGYKRDKSTSRWKHQQIIKLYSTLLIPNLLSQVLIMDGEVIWLHPTTFLDGYVMMTTPSSSTGRVGGGPVSLYTHGQSFGDRYNPKYEHFLESILPRVAKKVPGETFIAHHILIQKDILTSLMLEIEKLHGHSFWETFLHYSKYQGNPSEYELYSRFALEYFPERAKVRDLKYIDTGDCLYRDQHLDYLSCHHHLRTNAQM